MSIRQRVRKVINWYIFQDVGQNDTEIAEKLGYTKSSLSQILGGKVPMSDKFIDKLCSIDNNINKVWISTGDGNMFKTPLNTSIRQTVSGNQVQGDQVISNSIDNRQYYSDSPDVLRAQIDERDRLIVEKEKILNEKDERIREKDERIREKDERIREKDERIRELLKEKEELKEELKEYKG